MKANELMIANWVIDNGKYAQITGITCDGNIETTVNEKSNIELISPIPLTPEILEKNGFEEWDGWFIYAPESAGIEIAWLGTILKIGGECGNLELPTIEYVHQLQNVFMLCGISKEIVL